MTWSSRAKWISPLVKMMMITTREKGKRGKLREKRKGLELERKGRKKERA